MARPRKAETEQMSTWMAFRATAAQRRQIDEKAALLKLSPSEYVRRCAVQGTVKIVREEGHDPEKIRALLSIGNNLNQIARRMNTTGEPAPPELGEVIVTIRDMLTEIGRRRFPGDD